MEVVDLENIINSIKFTYLEENKDLIISDFLCLKRQSDIKFFYNLIDPNHPQFNPIQEVFFKFNYLYQNIFNIEYKYLFENNITIDGFCKFILERKEDTLLKKAKILEKSNLHESILLYRHIIENKYCCLMPYFEAIRRLSIILGKFYRYDLDLIVLQNGLKSLNKIEVSSPYMSAIFQRKTNEIKKRIEKSKKRIK